MAVDRALWRRRFTKAGLPDWHCPSCKGGYLRFLRFDFRETADSISNHKHPSWDHEWIEYRFAALLQCNNKDCAEAVSAAGSGCVEAYCGPGNDDEVVYDDVFTPSYIAPSPNLIPLRNEYPPAVVQELKRAFVTSWGDFSSSANHIRIAVERLLDHLGQAKFQVSAGKRSRLPLHSRILKYANSNKALSDALLAVKWLGNAGSHTDSISQDDIYDALDILETVLEAIATHDKERMKKLIAAVNKKKGPVKI